MTPVRRNGFRVPEQLLLPWAPRYTVSVAYAAEALDVSPQTIGRMIESGELRAYKVRENSPTSPWRISYDSLLEHVQKIHQDAGLEPRFEL